MALPKKNTRKIVIDDMPYRWITSGNDYGIDIYVEHYEQPGQLLWGRSQYKYDENGTQIGVAPSDVERLIRLALEKGWVAENPGPNFKLIE